jgi:hypothetical protein
VFVSVSAPAPAPAPAPASAPATTPVFTAHTLRFLSRDKDKDKDGGEDEIDDKSCRAVECKDECKPKDSDMGWFARIRCYSCIGNCQRLRIARGY